MAQNVTIAGASYSDVPSITVPKQGGGSASFVDTSDADATAGDIASGKTAYVNGEKITGTGGGGGTETIIVPEQTITVSSSYTQIQFNKPLVVGEEYIATVNGVTKTLTCVSQYGSLYLNFGNGLYFDYSAPNMYFDVDGSSQYGTYTVKVWQESGGGGSTLIEKSITANGVYNAADDDADGYSKVTVNVSGGGGLVYESGTYTPASDTQNPSISFTNSHSTRPFYIVILDDSTSLPASNSILLWQIVSYYDLYGSYMYNSSGTTTVYAELRYGNKTSSSGSYASGYVTSTSNLSTYMTSDGFTPAPTSTNRRFRAGRSYKWIAVWKPTT